MMIFVCLIWRNINNLNLIKLKLSSDTSQRCLKVIYVIQLHKASILSPQVQEVQNKGQVVNLLKDRSLLPLLLLPSCGLERLSVRSLVAVLRISFTVENKEKTEPS